MKEDEKALVSQRITLAWHFLKGRKDLKLVSYFLALFSRVACQSFVLRLFVNDLSRNKSKQVEIIFYVDSLEGLEIIKSFTPSDGIQNLFIEIGTINGRGGVRNLELVKEIAMSIHSDPRLNLRGVTGFEGAVPNISRTKDGENLVAEFCRRIVNAAQLSFEYKSDYKFIIVLYFNN